ncbi:MAG: LytR C-terminal domain-containing protein [Ilumatobacteraceae bacterium]
MSNEQPSRPRKSGSSASPMGSTLAIVIAIAAVVVGFLILKNIRSDSNKTTSTTTQPTLPTQDTSSTTQPTLPAESTTTVFTPITTGALVIVANSSHQNGVAKTLSTALQGKGFTMGTPVNGSAKVAATKIQYKSGDTNAQAVAQSIAVLMGVAAPIEVMPTPVALSDPTALGDATVLVLLGDDKASKTLAQMGGASATPSSGSTPTT